MFLPGCPSLKKGFLYGQPCRYWFFAFINKHTFQYADDCFITSQHALCICHLVTAPFFFTVIIPIMCASKSDRYPMSTTLDWNKPTRLMSPWPGSTEGQL